MLTCTIALVFVSIYWVFSFLHCCICCVDLDMGQFLCWNCWVRGGYKWLHLFFVFVPSSVSWLWRWGHNQQNHFSCASAYCPEDIFLNHWRFCYQTLCNGASPWTMLSYEIECLGQLSSKPRWWSGVRLLKYGCLSHVLWDMLFRKNEKKNCLRWHSIVSQSVGWLFCNATVNLTVPPNCNLRPQQEFVHPSLS